VQEKAIVKDYLHPRSYHRGSYDYSKLVSKFPPLEEHLITSENKLTTINYTDATAVKALNKAILLSDYGIEYWDIPDNYLCPAVPGRAEYLHHAADILGSFSSRFPTGSQVKCLDIGVGANCIYPIIGRKVYKWSFIGSDINEHSLKAAQKIVSKNVLLKEQVSLRQQKDPSKIIEGILQPDEYIDLVICNPPFFESAKAARQASLKKAQGLTKSKPTSLKTSRNFRGQHNELWCPGGELTFVRKLIQESQTTATSCFLYSSLISKTKNLEKLQIELDRAEVKYSTAIQLALGNKKSHILAWSFLKPKQMKIWAKARWK